MGVVENMPECIKDVKFRLMFDERKLSFTVVGTYVRDGKERYFITKWFEESYDKFKDMIPTDINRMCELVRHAVTKPGTKLSDL